MYHLETHTHTHTHHWGLSLLWHNQQSTLWPPTKVKAVIIKITVIWASDLTLQELLLHSVGGDSLRPTHLPDSKMERWMSSDLKPSVTPLSFFPPLFFPSRTFAFRSCVCLMCLPANVLRHKFSHFSHTQTGTCPRPCVPSYQQSIIFSVCVY